VHHKLWIQVLEVLKAKVSRPKKSTKGDLDFDHAPINQYLWLPRPLIPKIDVGSTLVVMVASMNCFWPPIQKPIHTSNYSKEKAHYSTNNYFYG
jgi:hypothetical protein